MIDSIDRPRRSERIVPENGVSVEREGALTVVRMHTERTSEPPFSITRKIWKGLGGAFREISQDPATRVVLLRGAGIAFGTGADFNELLKIAEVDKAEGNHNAAQDYWSLLNEAQCEIERCPKPVVAVIDRFALGAAFSLAMACDLRVASHNAKVGVPAARRGLTLGIVDTQRLVGKLGAALADEILVWGQEYDAQQALQKGLVTMVAEERRLEEAVARVTADLLKNAPLAIVEAKRNIDESMQNPGLNGIDTTGTGIAWAGSDDVVEGIRAFLEKREPNFTGQ